MRYIKDICDICVKELRSVFKDEGVIMFFILVPLLYPLLYSWVYNNEVVREVPVAVVDKSNSELSRQFTRMFDASPDARVAVRCGSLDEAKQLVGQQEVYGVLYFPEDFQTRLYRMQQTRMEVYCDMSLMLAYKAIYQTSTAVSADMNAQIQVSLAGNHTGREDEITTRPLDFEEVPIFNNTSGYGNFIIPGVLMLIIQQTLLLGVGMAGGTAWERREKRYFMPLAGRNTVMGTVWGKTLCYLMIYIVMAAYLLLAVPSMFHFVSMVHAKDVTLFILPYLLACTFFAMTLSYAVTQRENVMLLVVFSSVVLLFMSGVSWPQSNIPAFWQVVGWIFPSTFGIRGFVRMNTMGATLGDIATEYHALWAQVVVYFLTACLVYRKRMRQMA